MRNARKLKRLETGKTCGNISKCFAPWTRMMVDEVDTPKKKVDTAVKK
jgi:hypothetical protein